MGKQHQNFLIPLQITLYSLIPLRANTCPWPALGIQTLLSLLLGAKRVCSPPARHHGLAPKIPSVAGPAVGMEGDKGSLLFAKCLLVCIHAAKRSTCLVACNTHRIPGRQQSCPLVLCQGSETEVTHWLSQTQPGLHSDFPGPEATLPSRAPYSIKKY